MPAAPLCLVLNGLPGSGKSTIAREIVSGLPGTLALDIDGLRAMLGLATTDFAGAGDEVRPLATAVVREQVRLGRDVVIPQLYFTRAEMESVVAAASGAHVVHRLLVVDPDLCWQRVRSRAESPSASALERHVHELISARGGAAMLRQMEQSLFAEDFGDLAPVPVRTAEDLRSLLFRDDELGFRDDELGDST